MKILLAEDDLNISTIAKIALEQIGGHDVTVAGDGEAALDLACSEDFDLVMLDEMMPKRNGISVCEVYLEKKSSPAPVIFMSANSQESSVTQFQKLGAGFIPKPFDPKTICQQIEELLAASGAAA